MAEYKRLYNIMQQMVDKYQNEIVPELRKEIEKIAKERDAAVMDLKMYAGCVVCKDCAVAGLDDCSGCGYENEMFEWRGVCDENSGKEAEQHD